MHRLTTLLAAGALLLAGCGGSDEEASDLQPQSSSSGVSTYEVESEGFSVAIPTSWRALSADALDVGGELESVIEETPILRPYVEALRGPDSVMKFIAIDPEVEDEFATNVNVILEELPAGTTLAQYEEAFVSQLETLPNVIGDLDREHVELPAGEAVRATYRFETPSGGRTRTVSILQYVFVGNGAAYILTYTTLPDLEASYKQTFADSARSFRLTEP